MQKPMHMLSGDWGQPTLSVTVKTVACRGILLIFSPVRKCSCPQRSLSLWHKSVSLLWWYESKGEDITCLAQMHGLHSFLQQRVELCILLLTVSISFGLSSHNLCVLVSNHVYLPLKITIPLLVLHNLWRRVLYESVNQLHPPASLSSHRVWMGKSNQENIPPCQLYERKALQKTSRKKCS